MRVSPFRAADMLAMEARFMLARFDEEQAAAFFAAYEHVGNGFTIWWLDREGGPTPLLCGGAVQQHDEHATVWAVLSAHLPKVPMYVTKIAVRFIRDLPYRRVDALLQADVPEILGWSKILGLRVEARLAEYWPDGSDALIARRAADGPREFRAIGGGR